MKTGIKPIKIKDKDTQAMVDMSADLELFLSQISPAYKRANEMQRAELRLHNPSLDFVCRMAEVLNGN